MTAVRAVLRRLRHEIGESLRDLVSASRGALRRHARPRPRDPAAPMRILIVDELVPEPTFGAGFPRAAEMLQELVEAGWSATVYPMYAVPEDYELVRVRFPRGVTFLRATGERGLRRLMREGLDAYDAVLVSRPPVMRAFQRIRADLPDAIRGYCIYDAEAMFTTRDARRRALFEQPMSDHAHSAALDAEVALCRGVQAILSVTEAEARLFRQRTDAVVHVVGHPAVVRRDPPGFEGRADLLFVGRCTGAREDSPNVDSLIWFVEVVMPHLDLLLGTGYRLVIAGLADDTVVARIASPRVFFAGVVDNLGPWYDGSRVFVAPTRYAAGLPLKVVEAAAAGIACAVTTLLAEQLDFRHDVECTAAASAEDFAAGVASLYEDSGRWTRLRDSAQSRIAAEYSREAFSAAMRRVLEAGSASDSALAESA